MYDSGTVNVQTGCGAYPGAGGNDSTGAHLSMTDFAVIMLDHRISAIQPSIGSTAYTPLLNGTTGPSTQTILPGAKANTFNIGNTSQGNAQAFATTFQTNGWVNRLFDYACDESSCNKTILDAQATTMHAVTPPVAVFATTNLSTSISNGWSTDVDWMCSGIASFDGDQDPRDNNGPPQKGTYGTWLAGSSGPTRELCAYATNSSTGASQGNSNLYDVNYPGYAIDNTPVANRAMQWFEYWATQVTMDMYFHSTIGWTSYEAINGSYDPWIGGKHLGQYGDGLLLYPGRQAGNTHFPSGNLGITYPIWLPSVRLKHIRDGNQDFEYMNALTTRGQGMFVMNQVNGFMTHSYAFNNNPYAPAGAHSSDMVDARLAFGNALHHLTYPVVLSPPPTQKGTLQ
jgi:hypothetical protein